MQQKQYDRPWVPQVWKRTWIFIQNQRTVRNILRPLVQQQDLKPFGAAQQTMVQGLPKLLPPPHEETAGVRLQIWRPRSTHPTRAPAQCSRWRNRRSTGESEWVFARIETTPFHQQSKCRNNEKIAPRGQCYASSNCLNMLSIYSWLVAIKPQTNLGRTIWQMLINHFVVIDALKAKRLLLQFCLYLIRLPWRKKKTTGLIPMPYHCNGMQWNLNWLF